MDSDRPESTTEHDTQVHLHPDQRELQEILESSRAGIAERRLFGKDGVLRTVNLDLEVVNAIPLPTRLIKALLDRTPHNQELEDIWRGVDGTTVPREKWFHPDKGILPTPWTEQEKEEMRRYDEENKELLEERARKRERGEVPSCRATVKSDYDLAPKKAEGDK
jgi:hypothetical protein